MTTKKFLIFFIFFLFLFEGAGFVFGQMTADNIPTWYQGLNRSVLNPPGWVFGVVWPILYGLLAAFAAKLFNERRLIAKSGLLLFLFAAQMILNWAWTPLFFVMHETGLALACLGAMLALTMTLYIYVWREKHVALAVLLLPYVLWLGFAFYLNWYIWAHNPTS